jgi:hypothetical protein
MGLHALLVVFHTFVLAQLVTLVPTVKYITLVILIHVKMEVPHNLMAIHAHAYVHNSTLDLSVNHLSMFVQVTHV